MRGERDPNLQANEYEGALSHLLFLGDGEEIDGGREVAGRRGRREGVRKRWVGDRLERESEI